jgi:FkbM family methyltransferase
MEIHLEEIASQLAFFTGSYERGVTIWCLEMLRQNPPALVVDVGANFGYYPLLFGLRSEGNTKTIAFEPDPRTYRWLCRNLELNPSLNVIAVPQVVGDSNETTVQFETSLEGHSLWSRVGGMGANEHASMMVDVPCTTLDTYLDKQGIGRVPVVLIDVEGYESRVLHGMSRGIADQRYSSVMVEFHPSAFADPVAEIERIAGQFMNAGYTGRRFNQFNSRHRDPDKDPSFYRLSWTDSILGPLTSDNLTSWEHYLFTAGDAAKP